MKVSNRHAVVTGGGTGVGAAIAVDLARAGATVTILGRREEPLIKLASTSPNIEWACADVTNVETLQQAISAAREKSGRIDIVIANAGAASSKPFAQLSADDMQGMLNVNLMGVFNTFQAVLPEMIDNGWGRMIAVASTAGLKGYGYVSHYCAAKHGVIGMIKSLALELARKGITVNAVCPSYVDTDMTTQTIANIMKKTQMSEAEAVASLVASNPQRRLITPGEVADTVTWLCGEGASAINGQAVSISGGEI